MSVYMLRAQIRELLDTKILPLIAKGDFSVKSVCAFLEEANKTTAGKDFAEEIDYGNGLYHVSKTHATKIILRHIIEPVPGYSLEVYRNARDGKDENRAHILFNPSEAFGLYEAFSGSMSRICFG